MHLSSILQQAAATPLLAGASSALVSAGGILATDALGCGLIYCAGRFMGQSYAEQHLQQQEQKISNAASSSKATKTFAKFWKEVKIKNVNRCIPRISVKVIGVLALLLAGYFNAPAAGSASSACLPTITQMVLFTSWYGSMGMSDEFDDLEDFMKNKQSRRFGKLVQLALMIPIPFLMILNPVLYVSFAIYQLAAHSLSRKIDSTCFQITAAMGLACALTVARMKRVVFPLTGMAFLVLSNALWQIHDEHPLLIRLTDKFPFMTKVFDICSFHTVMVLLVACQVLPLAWLSVTSASYAASKVGVADGSLCAVNVAVQQSTQTTGNFRAALQHE